MTGLNDPEDLAPDQGSLALAAPGAPATQGDWERAAAAVLRKTRALTEQAPDNDAWAALTRTTLDGIAVTPLGRREDLDGLVTQGRPTRAGAWDVRTQVEVAEAKTANAEILADLENGAASVLLYLDGHESPDWEVLLDGVLLDLAPVALERPTTEQVEGFAAFLAGRDLHPHTNLGFDLQTSQMLPERVRDDGQEAADFFEKFCRQAMEMGVRGLVVDGCALHEGGASEAQELGWVIATGIGYLRLLAEAGVSVDEAASLIEFRIAATDEQFLTIAKLRAVRRLWARVLEASGGSAAEMALHAVTSRPMSSGLDPYVNMLRGTVAAFAAGVGGADAVTVVPFDEPLGRPDAFGRRIARNTSSLLIEESHVAQVADPAGGSYAVEKLTDDLAAAGWAQMQQIESDGGAFADEARRGVKSRVRETRTRREAEIADRSRPLTGVSEFPNLAETLPERPPGVFRYARRYGRAFEDMRARPVEQRVFLATMGTVAAHTARASFATNLFAAGGVAVDSANATAGPDDVTAAYSGQPVVCLAGTDAAYAEWGAAAIEALRAAGASYVVLAGKPGDRTVPVESIDDSCAIGVDALAFLGRVRAALGVEQDS